MQNSSTNNPWCVDNLEEFLYFCCPECDNVKHQSRTDFINHALDQHPDSKDCISKIKKIKKEKTKNEYKFSKNNHNNEEENSEDYDEGEENDNNDAESADFDIQNYVKCEISEENANINDNLNKNLSEDSSSWNENVPLLSSTNNYNIYICDVCEKTFNDKLAFKRHIRVHDESRHKCSTCDKSFKSETKLQDHIDWYHSGIKKYTCQFCEVSFGTVQQLSVHMSRKNHEGTKGPNHLLL